MVETLKKVLNEIVVFAKIIVAGFAQGWKNNPGNKAPSPLNPKKSNEKRR